ncbi:MAG: hypothetical protein KKA79_00700 [Nanoarchaeota archaeon]|nr:hypothetical protein [Nanoarchaeota archaeon]
MEEKRLTDILRKEDLLPDPEHFDDYKPEEIKKPYMFEELEYAMGFKNYDTKPFMNYLKGPEDEEEDGDGCDGCDGDGCGGGCHDDEGEDDDKDRKIIWTPDGGGCGGGCGGCGGK